MNWLVTLLAIAGGLGLWIWMRIRVARQWGRIFAAAAEAEKRGDLPAAERNLREADAFAAKQSGVLWRARLDASKAMLARVLFKSGQLERSAALTFDVLQQLRANP